MFYMFSVIGTIASIGVMAASGVGLSAVIKFLYTHEFTFGKDDGGSGSKGSVSRPGMDRHTDSRKKLHDGPSFIGRD